MQSGQYRENEGVYGTEGCIVTELFDQPDFVCIECPLAECDEESLFCAFRWATFPNQAQQKAMTMRQARHRRKIKAKPRTEYFRKRYQEKKRQEAQTNA